MAIRVLFMGRKPYAAKALQYVVDRGAEVVGVVAPDAVILESERSALVEVATRNGIPILNRPGENTSIDLVISYFYWRRIRQPLIAAAKIGVINCHASPTPPMRGVCGYSFGIYWNLPYWGATVHWIDDETFDTGDIVERRIVPSDLSAETALSLERKSQEYLLEAFRDAFDGIIGGDIVRIPQDSLGPSRHCNTKADFEAMKLIDLKLDSEREIYRKVRACWFPPHEGATLVVGGQRWSLATREMLEDFRSGVEQGIMNANARHSSGSAEGLPPFVYSDRVLATDTTQLGPEWRAPFSLGRVRIGAAEVFLISPRILKKYGASYACNEQVSLSR